MKNVLNISVNSLWIWLLNSFIMSTLFGNGNIIPSKYII